MSAKLSNPKWKYHPAIENTPALIWVTDPEGCLLYVNRGWRDYTGRDLETLDTSAILSVLHPEDTEKLLRAWPSRERTFPFEMEIRVRRADDVYRWHLLRMRPLIDEDGIPLSWSGICVDVDEIHRSQETLQFLSAAGDALAISLDLRTTLRLITELAVPQIADWCTLYLLRENELEPAATAHHDPNQRELGEHIITNYRHKPDSPINRAIQTGETIFLPVITSEIVRKAAQDERHLDLLHRLSMTSAIFAPLRSRGKVLGLLQFVIQNGRRTYTRSDVRAAQDLARRAALAIENAQLFEREQQTAEFLRFLADASLVFAESLDLDTRLKRLTSIIVPRIASWAAIHLLTPEGTVETVAIEHRDPRLAEITASLRGAHYGKTRPPDGATLLVPTIDEAFLIHNILPEKIAAIRTLGAQSGIFAPLVARGRTLGWISALRTKTDPPYTRQDLPLFEELARRAAAGIDNAQLFAREQTVAETFQFASLPARLPSNPSFSFSGYYEPGRAEALVGGDWYDALRLPDGRIVVSIGDVSGSGLQAAIIMGSVRQVIRGVAHINPDPATILEAADKALQSQHPDRLVTAFVGILDPLAHTLSYALAGHPPPMLRLPDGTVRELPGGGLPLGLRNNEDPTTTIALSENSILVLYTDGLIESTRDIFEGQARVRRALGEADFNNAALARTVATRVLHDGSSDDVAILTIHVRPVMIRDLQARRWSFDANDRQQARAALDGYLAYLHEQGAEGDYDGAALVFLELIGNAVRHAPGKIDVMIDWEESAPVLHVIDEGPGFQPDDTASPLDPMRENGRGLSLISAFTENVQVIRRRDGGSHVRAMLPFRRRRKG